METHHHLCENLERVIMKDDTSSSVTTEEDPNLQQFRTTREKIATVLHSHKFQVGVITLVIFDCLLVIGELLVDLSHPDFQDYNTIAEVLHYMSIGILSIFLVEITVKLYAFRLEFFHHKMEIFDALVVIVSFALDITFNHSHTSVNGVGLLIILRLWRVTRILNGIVMSVKIQAERRLHKEQRAKDALEQELAKFREYCASQEQEIESLRALLRKHGIAEGKMVERSPALANRVDVVAEVNHLNDKKTTNGT